MVVIRSTVSRNLTDGNAGARKLFTNFDHAYGRRRRVRDVVSARGRRAPERWGYFTLPARVPTLLREFIGSGYLIAATIELRDGVVARGTATDRVGGARVFLDEEERVQWSIRGFFRCPCVTCGLEGE